MRLLLSLLFFLTSTMAASQTSKKPNNEYSWGINAPAIQGKEAQVSLSIGGQVVFQGAEPIINSKDGPRITLLSGADLEQASQLTGEVVITLRDQDNRLLAQYNFANMWEARGKDAFKLGVFISSIFEAKGRNAQSCTDCLDEYISCSFVCDASHPEPFWHSICMSNCQSQQIACEAASCDNDLDGLVNYMDNCPHNHNPDQANCDGDGYGNACDTLNGIYVQQAYERCHMYDSSEWYNPFEKEVKDFWAETLVDVSACNGAQIGPRRTFRRKGYCTQIGNTNCVWNLCVGMVQEFPFPAGTDGSPGYWCNSWPGGVFGNNMCPAD